MSQTFPWMRSHQQETATDAVINGVLFQDVNMRKVQIESPNDLAILTGYSVGTIAYTAGFGNMWQLDSHGNWVKFVGGNE